MKIINELLNNVPEGAVEQVLIGLHWTAVVMAVDGERRCGLASTMRMVGPYGEVDVPPAGRLTEMTGREVAGWANSDHPTRRSIGLAGINALLPPRPERWREVNAEAVIAEAGAGKTVVLVGHFAFIPRLEPLVGTLYVLEQNPAPDEYPATAAVDLVPQADVVAITSMTLLNRTLAGLLALARPEARILLLGPSTPLHPLLFDYGIEMLSGAQVTAIDPVLKSIREGGVFRQVHQAGVQLVTMM